MPTVISLHILHTPPTTPRSTNHTRRPSRELGRPWSFLSSKAFLKKFLQRWHPHQPLNKIQHHLLVCHATVVRRWGGWAGCDSLSKRKNAFETKDEGLYTFHVWVKSPQVDLWVNKQPFLDQYDVTMAHAILRIRDYQTWLTIKII